MSGSGNFGLSTAITALQNIQQAISNLATVMGKLVIGAAGNNNFTGNNTFTGTTSFKPPSIISAGAVGSGTLQPEGLVSNQTSIAGVGNGANTTDDLLFSYSLPANSFDQNGRALRVVAYGLFGATGNDKRVKMKINAFTWFDSGVITQNATGWYINAQFTLSTANTVTGYSMAFASNALLGAVGSGSAGGFPTNAPILFTITGASPTTGAANDVVANGLVVEFLN